MRMNMRNKERVAKLLRNKGRVAKLLVITASVIAFGLIISALTTSSETSSFLSPALPPVETRMERTLTATLAQISTPTLTTLSESRMVVFTARISLEVPDVKMASVEVGNIAERLGGYVAGSTSSVVEGRDLSTVTIRVPKGNFHAALFAIEALGNLKAKEVQSDDVTQEFVDLKARRDNLVRQEKRLHEILALGRSVEEVLKVEKELERVRGEIERLTARMNYLERRVDLSTITAAITQPVETPFPELDWLEPFKTGLGFMYQTLRGLVILAFAAFFPLAFIGLPSYFYYKNWRSRRAKAAPSPTST